MDVRSAGPVMPDEPTTLYRFYAADGILLYVGTSADPASRWKSHRKVQPWWASVSRIDVEHFASRSTARAAETAAIQTERPLHNFVHNGPSAVARIRRPRRAQREVIPMRVTPTGPIYVAEAEWHAGWWAITVPDVPGVFTQARRLSGVQGVEVMARGAIAVLLDVAADSFRVRVEPRMTGDLGRRVEDVRAAREVAERLAAEAARKTNIAIEALVEAGITVRDAGSLLHLSPQRISQLTAQRRAEPAA